MVKRFNPSKYTHIYKRKAFLVEFKPDSLLLLRKGYRLARWELSQLSGVSERYIEDLETGKKKRPSLEIISKLGDSLNVIFFL